MKIIKSCINGDTSCQETVDILKGTPNPGPGFTSATSPVFITADGIIFEVQNANCATTAHPDVSKIKNTCGWLLVDINGNKKPNIMGKDIFGLGNVSQDGYIYPDASIEFAKMLDGSNWASSNSYWRNEPFHCGSPNQTISQSSATQIIGQNCLARIMENGWAIDYY